MNNYDRQHDGFKQPQYSSIKRIQGSSYHLQLELFKIFSSLVPDNSPIWLQILNHNWGLDLILPKSGHRLQKLVPASWSPGIPRCCVTSYQLLMPALAPQFAMRGLNSRFSMQKQSLGKDCDTV
jgi:hypothetical protein